MQTPATASISITGFSAGARGQEVERTHGMMEA